MSVLSGGNILNGVFVKEIGFDLSTDIDETQNKPKYLNINISSFEVKGMNGSLEVTASYEVPKKEYSEVGSPFIKAKDRFKVTDRVFNIGKAIIDADYIKCNEQIEYMDSRGNIKIGSDKEYCTVEYYKIENNFEYQGFKSDGKFISLDLNTKFGHYYIDPVSYTENRTSDLIGRTVYVFLKPKNISLSSGEIIVTNNECFYHRIENSEPFDNLDIMIGVVYVSSPYSYNTIKTDESSIIGGGIKEEFITKDARGIFDIHVDPIMVKNSSTLISTIDENILTKDEFIANMTKYLPIGTVNIV